MYDVRTGRMDEGAGLDFFSVSSFILAMACVSDDVDVGACAMGFCGGEASVTGLVCDAMGALSPMVANVTVMVDEGVDDVAEDAAAVGVVDASFDADAAVSM